MLWILISGLNEITKILFFHHFLSKVTKFRFFKEVLVIFSYVFIQFCSIYDFSINYFQKLKLGFAFLAFTPHAHYAHNKNGYWIEISQVDIRLQMYSNSVMNTSIFVSYFVGANTNIFVFLDTKVCICKCEWILIHIFTENIVGEYMRIHTCDYEYSHFRFESRPGTASDYVLSSLA